MISRLRLASLLAISLLTLANLPAPAQSVFLSELADPRQNYLTDRFVEIYNAGPTAVDLTGWQIVAVGNGSPIFTWNLSGSIAPGEALVAGDANPVVAFPIDFPAAAWSSSNSTWNGKVGDGARLIDASSSVIDEVVAPGTLFENRDLVRVPGVTSPSPGYVAAEWSSTAIDLPTEGSPGTHDAGTAFPTVDDVTIDPSAPLAGEAVTVTANVTGGGATLVSVELRWGSSPGSLPNVIAMTASAGDAWVTTSSIPGQSPGASVHFEVEATNDVPASTVSDPQSYTIATTISIASIQGNGSASPFVGTTVRTQGVVTATNGDRFTVQDGTGDRSGIWLESSAAPALGDLLDVQGSVDEAVGGSVGTTFLVATDVLSSSPGALPAPRTSTSGTVSEDEEGMLLEILDATCTNAGNGTWQIDDGSGVLTVGTILHDATRVLGTRYDVRGVVREVDGVFHVEPRSAADVVATGDDFAPVIVSVEAPDAVSVIVRFSEALDPVTATQTVNYSLAGATIFGAALVGGDPTAVDLTTTDLGTDSYTLVVTDVEDLFGNAIGEASAPFDANAYPPPVGYYASAEGLTGSALRDALHVIIDDHTVVSYSTALAVFQTSDAKPNGKVWDMYSDTPGSTPPYEYTFGVDAGSSASDEGQGYNREHSWPRAWFGGAVSPMNSDLFQLYPTDIYVNSIRGSFPYGEVGTPDYVSANGSQRGASVTPGYSGTVFEPIDAYKGDFARSYFYMTVRYHTEDGSWPSSAMTDGADLLPWAQDLLYAWHLVDPVSEKERARNQVLFGVQENRNPFIDRPEFAAALFEIATSVEQPAITTPIVLRPNAPNPFSHSTAIAFALTRPVEVDLAIFDLRGRLVRDLVDGSRGVGAHTVVWDARDATGNRVAGGTYFYRLRAGDEIHARRMVLLR